MNRFTVTHRPGAALRLWALALLPGAALVIAACGSDTTGSSSAGSSSSAASSSVTVSTASTTSLGTVLVGPNGHTLYSLVDASGTPQPCTGACAATWPPLTAASGSTPQAGSGVTTSLSVGSGSQVMAGTLPLYYFSGDSNAGDTNGEGIQAGSATWYAIGANGQPVKGGGAAAQSTHTPNYGAGY